jgi:Tol biopolymer transport system component
LPCLGNGEVQFWFAGSSRLRINQETAMGERSPGAPPSERPLEDRLDSWKEIAAYLKRDVTTAQRWEKREGMPVYRHLHDKIGSVYASRAELDAWMRSRGLRGTRENGNGAIAPDSPSPPPVANTPAVRGGRRPLFLLGAAALAIAVGIGLWLHGRDAWRNPLANAQFQTVTDFDGLEQAATLSRDGKFVAFLSDRGGRMDVWVTQVGSGEFHNLTQGRVAELPNPSIRTLGFSPDGSLVTFWLRKPSASGAGDIGIWAVPTLGGEPRPYLEGVGEFDWSHDGTRLVYHTPGPGDPLFVTDGTIRPGNRPIFTASPGLHSHFPLWAPDGSFVYFVQGTLPDKLDVWRIRPGGGSPERITSHMGRVNYPVLLDRRTLVYLAGDSDSSGPWLYGMDVERRIPHRLISGVDRYTSLAASADGRRLVATVASPKRTLWRLRIAGSSANPTLSQADSIPLTTGSGFFPRLGPDYLLYVSATGAGDTIWRLANGTSTELWRGEGARVLGAPAIAPNQTSIAFSIQQQGRTLLYVMNVDGTNARIASDSLNFEGAPGWAADSRSILSAANDHGIPRLFRVPLGGGSPVPLVQGYSVDPAWAPDGNFGVYSGPDIGTTFSVKAINADGSVHAMPALTLTRGARRLAFLPGGRGLVFLRGEIQHKNLWSINLETGVERQLTDLPPDFNIRDFDISPDGSEVVFERMQDHSNLVLIDLPPS